MLQVCPTMARIVFICCTLLLVTSGCSNRVKEKVGFASSGPDEYMVSRGRGLEVPPQLDVLPAPGDTANLPNYNTSDRKLDKAEQALMSEIDSKLSN